MAVIVGGQPATTRVVRIESIEDLRRIIKPLLIELLKASRPAVVEVSFLKKLRGGKPSVEAVPSIIVLEPVTEEAKRAVEKILPLLARAVEEYRSSGKSSRALRELLEKLSEILKESLALTRYAVLPITLARHGLEESESELGRELEELLREAERAKVSGREEVLLRFLSLLLGLYLWLLRFARRRASRPPIALLTV